MPDYFKPDEPWAFVDWDRVQDALAGLIKQADEDKRLRKEYSAQLDIKSRQLREVVKENEELKLKIKMLERG